MTLPLISPFLIPCIRQTRHLRLCNPPSQASQVVIRVEQSGVSPSTEPSACALISSSSHIRSHDSVPDNPLTRPDSEGGGRSPKSRPSGVHSSLVSVSLCYSHLWSSTLCSVPSFRTITLFQSIRQHDGGATRPGVRAPPEPPKVE